MTQTFAPPIADTARQAVAAIGGYVYQALAAARAWVELDEDSLLYLEVAEDYAKVARREVEAVQVKNTAGPVTLRHADVRDAIAAFVDLAAKNADRRVRLRFLTTSTIGSERSAKDRPGGHAGLEYWRRVRAGQADIAPLRELLEDEPYPAAVREFCAARSDGELRRDLVDRIHWDCGMPDYAGLRRELERALSTTSGSLRVPMADASRVADVLVHHVLVTSGKRSTDERLLTAAALNEVVDAATWISLPRDAFEALLRSVVPPTTTATAQINAPSLDSLHWVVEGSLLPTPSQLIARPALRDAILRSQSSAGVTVVHGATGVGKSMAARDVAARHPGGFHWIDLRVADAAETQRRLDNALPLLSSMASSAIIVDDVEFWHDPAVQRSFAWLLDACRRHDIQVLATTYTEPSKTVLDTFRIDLPCVVACPHFSQAETDDLVRAFGGDPAKWGRVAHAVGGQGHPQLTYAFITSMSTKAWPDQELTTIIANRLTTPDVDAERDAAKKRLQHTLPTGARDLLGRLSIVAGQFKHSLALTIGAVLPPIPRAGEHLNLLVDRWIESSPGGRYRSSPLIRGLAGDMLTGDEQRTIHDAIAKAMLADSPIDVGDIDMILTHALAGRSTSVLRELCHLVITQSPDKQKSLAEHLLVFPLFDTSRPIYRHDMLTSILLRLAQSQLTAASGNTSDTAKVASALLRESAETPTMFARSEMELAVFASVLNTIGIAGHIDNWVGLLHRYRELLASRPDLAADIHMHGNAVGGLAALFNVGVTGIRSVAKLRGIVEDMAALESNERAELLTPIDGAFANYELLVHAAWTNEARQGTLDPTEAAASYEHMYDVVAAWNTPALAAQCAVAAATICDRHLDEPRRALQILTRSYEALRQHPVLTVALGDYHLSHGRLDEALRQYRSFVASLGDETPISALFALRHAAITAGKCAAWAESRAWFLRASKARSSSEPNSLLCMRVGLVADAAVASYEAGDAATATRLLKGTLKALAEVDPSADLHGAYCHRIIRHTVLWLRARVLDEETLIGGLPISVSPGVCSETEPLDQIRDLPLAHLDVTWYQLAEVEATGGLDEGVREELDLRTGEAGKIAALELLLVQTRLKACIKAANPLEFCRDFMDNIAVVLYAQDPAMRSTLVLDPERPGRANMPGLTLGDWRTTPRAAALAGHFILAFGLHSLFTGRTSSFSELRDCLRANFGDSYPGHRVVEDITPGSTDMDGRMMKCLRACTVSPMPRPEPIWAASFESLVWVTQSVLVKSVIEAPLAGWLRDQWRRILETQRFALRNPRTTIPRIEEALRSNKNGTAFAATLVLATADAVRSGRWEQKTEAWLLGLAGEG